MSTIDHFCFDIDLGLADPRWIRLSLTGSLDLSPKYPMEAARRFCGLDWPSERGFTMVGLVRLILGKDGWPENDHPLKWDHLMG